MFSPRADVSRLLLAAALAGLVATLSAQTVRTPRVVEAAVSELRVEPVRDPGRPAVFVVGDKARDHGPGEGWGDFLAPFFDERRIQVLNWALEGTTASRIVDGGRWRVVLAQMRAGDYVLIQFANDGERLRQYIGDARAKGVSAVLVSPAARASADGIPFIDLDAAMQRVYDELGPDTVRQRFFIGGNPAHTSAEGAHAQAAAVVDGVRGMPQLGLSNHLRPSAAVPRPPDPSWARGIEGQRRADLGNGFYLNPIVSGDRPDPSILKDGDDYYMTFSSFDAYPGLVIWHSRDLVNWRPIGPTLFRHVGAVWAPDLVKHGNRYYIYFPGIAPRRSNYVIWADDIRGPWSDPIDLKIGRIDPGHAVGSDGRRYLFLSAGYLVPLAPDGLSVAGPERKIYDGWKYPAEWIVEGFAQEGPKIFKKGDYYYQVLAQGGTAGPPTGHMIVSARAKQLEGPWENSPHNPIVRTQSRDERWWSKGHGTVVEGPDRRWWMVYHAYENGYQTLGRQTLLEPIEWLEDGWFRAAGYDAGRPIPKPVPASSGAHGAALSDDFSANRIGTQWAFYRGAAQTAPVPDTSRVRYEGGSLVLAAAGTSPRDSAPLSVVTGDHAYEVSVDIDADPGATAGLLLFYNQRLYAGLGFSATNFIMHSYGLDRPGGKPAGLGQRLHLRLRNDRHMVTIDYSVDGRTWQRYDRGMELAGYHHNVGYDFLSLRPALYAAGTGEVRFRNFAYRALP